MMKALQLWLLCAWAIELPCLVYNKETAVLLSEGLEFQVHFHSIVQFHLEVLWFMTPYLEMYTRCLSPAVANPQNATVKSRTMGIRYSRNPASYP